MKIDIPRIHRPSQVNTSILAGGRVEGGGPEHRNRLTAEDNLPRRRCPRKIISTNNPQSKRTIPYRSCIFRSFQPRQCAVCVQGVNGGGGCWVIIGRRRVSRIRMRRCTPTECKRFCAGLEIIHRPLGRNELTSSIPTPSGGETWILSLKDASRGSVDELRNRFRLGRVVLVIECS